MIDYKTEFEFFSKMSPKMEYHHPEGGISTIFWENLYQAFKARMLAESNDEEGK